MRSVAPGAAARMAARIFAKSPRASFGHLAMYASTLLLSRFVTVAFSRCCRVFFTLINCRDFTGDSRPHLLGPLGSYDMSSLWRCHMFCVLVSELKHVDVCKELLPRTGEHRGNGGTEMVRPTMTFSPRSLAPASGLRVAA